MPHRGNVVAVSINPPRTANRPGKTVSSQPAMFGGSTSNWDVLRHHRLYADQPLDRQEANASHVRDDLLLLLRHGRRRRAAGAHRKVAVSRRIGVFAITLAVPFAAALTNAIAQYSSSLRVPCSPCHRRERPRSGNHGSLRPPFCHYGNTSRRPPYLPIAAMTPTANVVPNTIGTGLIFGR